MVKRGVRYKASVSVWDIVCVVRSVESDRESFGVVRGSLQMRVEARHTRYGIESGTRHQASVVQG